MSFEKEQDACVMDYGEFLNKYAPVPPSTKTINTLIKSKPNKEMSNKINKPLFSFNQNLIHGKLVDELSDRINIILTDKKIDQNVLAKAINFNQAWISILKNKKYTSISSRKVRDIAISFRIIIDGFDYRNYTEEWDDEPKIYAADIFADPLIKGLYPENMNDKEIPVTTDAIEEKKDRPIHLESYPLFDKLKEEHKSGNFDTAKALGTIEPELTKPPIGIMPEFIWKEKRLDDVTSAILRYIDAGLPILDEWVKERNKLLSEISQRKGKK